MAYWTWQEIRTKVERDLDSEDEVMVTEAELLGYANEAIREVERQLHKLCEDYFLKSAPITLVQGTESYDLPADIYAMKIRGLIYRNGSSVWQANRIRDWRKFVKYEAELTGTQNTKQYGFFISNATAGDPQLILSPTPQESGQYLKLWYIREANQLVDETSVCDIPEAINYVMQYMKVRYYEKENHPMLGKAVADLEQEKETTLAVMSSMVVDNENLIEVDTQIYDEMN